MTFSKIVSGMPGYQTLWKSGTVLASRAGPEAHLMYTGIRDTVVVPADSIFYAPYTSDLRDYALDAPFTFGRASDATYLDTGGQWRVVGQDVARFESAGLLLEPSVTNKCANYNADPDVDLTNMTKIGNSESVLSRVLDSSLISQSGLSELCSSGYVFELDNSGGSVNASAIIEEQAGELSMHTASAFGVATQGTAYVGIENVGNAAAFPVGGAMVRHSYTGTTADVQNRCVITCEAGAICRFVLTQFEALSIASSPVITLGASSSRVIDMLNYTTPVGFDSRDLTAVFDWTPAFNADDITLNTRNNLVSFAEATDPGVGTNRWWYFLKTSGNEEYLVQIRETGFANLKFADKMIAGERLRVGVRALGDWYFVGYEDTGGVWRWGQKNDTQNVVNDGTMRIGQALLLPFHMKNLNFLEGYISEEEFEQRYSSR